MRIIAGRNRGTLISAPEGQSTRPTLDRVRESLFNILSPRIMDASVLDLFAGSGALAFEALSRGACSAVLCDHDPAAIRCEKANAEKLRMTDRAEINQQDWQSLVAVLAKQGRRFDLIFLDPPYAMDDLTIVTKQLRPLLAENGMIVIEHPASSFPKISDGYVMRDNRRYGYAAISFFTIGGNNEQ